MDAGNVRIEGLYFDHVERVPSRIVEGSTVRVGLSAQGVPFPAPTGIVDYNLTLYEGKSILSGMVERGPFGGVAGNLELRLPLAGEKLGIAGGFGFREQRVPLLWRVRRLAPDGCCYVHRFCRCVHKSRR